ncbi:hypothetical protein QYF61_010291 [Mycteria americana]|uniref:Uncharacterized protein n=1 Tax=Mycteria americana TaxID=33587 RepID=A0AAN7MI00_MYCAM|nr:hypothetical protein QYF61_010291 [Mycteria americana]
MGSLLLLKVKPVNQFLYCFFDLLVPHAVDEGVHCWRNHRVHNSHHQIQRWGGDGGGLQVGNHGSADKQGDHSQVRDARGKGFVPSLLRGDPQHSPEDLHIGQHNENKTPKSKDKTGDNRPNFPEHSIEKPTAPGSCCHVDTSSAAQEDPVMQGLADGKVAVVGHDGDGPDVPQGIGHGFGDSGGDGAQVKNREVEEEEVHGGVEAVVAGYSADDEAVAQEGSQVDAQEEPEVQELQLPRVCKCQEEELGDTPVLAGHLRVASTLSF